MPIEDFYELMPATIVHRAAGDKDAYGKVASYSSPTPYRARVSIHTSRRVSRITGDDTLTSTVVWCPVIPGLKVDDQITLPDGTTPLLVDWAVVPDENGPHHCKLFLR
jgi:hypothetical protein